MAHQNIIYGHNIAAIQVHSHKFQFLFLSSVLFKFKSYNYVFKAFFICISELNKQFRLMNPRCILSRYINSLHIRL